MATEHQKCVCWRWRIGACISFAHDFHSTMSPQYSTTHSLQRLTRGPLALRCTQLPPEIIHLANSRPISTISSWGSIVCLVKAPCPSNMLINWAHYRNPFLSKSFWQRPSLVTRRYSCRQSSALNWPSSLSEFSLLIQRSVFLWKVPQIIHSSPRRMFRCKDVYLIKRVVILQSYLYTCNIFARLHLRKRFLWKSELTRSVMRRAVRLGDSVESSELNGAIFGGKLCDENLCSPHCPRIVRHRRTRSP